MSVGYFDGWLSLKAKSWNERWWGHSCGTAGNQCSIDHCDSDATWQLTKLSFFLISVAVCFTPKHFFCTCDGALRKCKVALRVNQQIELFQECVPWEQRKLELCSQCFGLTLVISELWRELFFVNRSYVFLWEEQIYFSHWVLFHLL